MEVLNQLVSLIMPLGVLIACLYMVSQVRKALEQFQRFEKLFRSLRESNTKSRFMASSVKDRMALIETTIADLQSQVDIIRECKPMETKSTEEKTNGNR